MTTAVLDRLATGGAAILDRLTPTASIPVITSIGTVQDGAAITITGTGFSASGNSVFLTQLGNTLQLTVNTEGTTSIVTTALNTSGLYLSQPVTISVTNVSAVASNSISTTIQSKAAETVKAITQQFLGDAGTRLAASPDAGITDEWRIKNVTGIGAVGINDITLTGQGAFVVTALGDGSKVVQNFDAALFDGTVLGAFATQTVLDPPTTGSVPSIRSETLVQAQADLVAAGFAFAVQPGVQDASVALGLVSGQFPAAGASWPLGAVVEITPSLGANGVIAPNLQVLSKADAETLRASLRLVGASTPYIDGNNSGQVLNQSVAPGTLMTVGATLDFIYSSNLMPAGIVGQQVGRAQAVIVSANLTNNDAVTRLPDPLYALDIVSATSPVAGAVVNPGDVVTLTVSTGPAAPVIAGTPTQFRSYGHKGRKGMSISSQPRKR